MDMGWNLDIGFLDSMDGLLDICNKTNTWNTRIWIPRYGILYAASSFISASSLMIRSIDGG
jgi:hypothetical protein